MRLQRLLFAMSATAFMCTAQQNTTGTNDLSSLQHQRLVGTSSQTGATTGIVAGRTTNPNTVNGEPINPTLADYGSGTDQGNIGHFVTMSDKQFATMMASRSMLEIPLGRLAAERGNTAAVRQLGQRMVDDYTRWSSGMAKASAGLNIKLPTELDPKRKATLDRISGLSGPEFDAAYLKEMVTLQNKALTIAQYEAANAGVSGFRHWAGVMVPIIQEQLHETKLAMNGDTVEAKR